MKIPHTENGHSFRQFAKNRLHSFKMLARMGIYKDKSAGFLKAPPSTKTGLRLKLKKQRRKIVAGDSVRKSENHLLLLP